MVLSHSTCVFHSVPITKVSDHLWMSYISLSSKKGQISQLLQPLQPQRPELFGQIERKDFPLLQGKNDAGQRGGRHQLI